MAWRIENLGSADLLIDQAKSSCGCTVVALTPTQKRIPPGQSISLEAEFDSKGRRGEQNKTVSVFSNDKSQPVVILELLATVVPVAEFQPASLVNLRAVQRGATASKTLDVLPGEASREVVVDSIEFDEPGLVNFRAEPLMREGASGRRIHFTIADGAPIGVATLKGRLAYKVAEKIRWHDFTLRMDVIGDLTWQPLLIDATRHETQRGRKLAPLTIRASDKRPFQIVSASAGPMFDVEVAQPTKTRSSTRFDVALTLRDDVPDGPFAAQLIVETDSLDQPLIDVPVFGVVAKRIAVDPAILVFRLDGTPAGRIRQMTLKVAVGATLEITGMSCPFPQVQPREGRGGRLPHLRLVDVEVVGELPVGIHESELQLSTNLPDLKQVNIPLRIIVPDSG